MNNYKGHLKIPIAFYTPRTPIYRWLFVNSVKQEYFICFKSFFFHFTYNEQFYCVHY